MGNRGEQTALRRVLSQSQTEVSRQSCSSDLGEVSATLVTLQGADIKNIVFVLTPPERVRQTKEVKVRPDDSFYGASVAAMKLVP